MMVKRTMLIAGRYHEHAEQQGAEEENQKLWGRPSFCHEVTRTYSQISLTINEKKNLNWSSNCGQWSAKERPTLADSSCKLAPMLSFGSQPTRPTPFLHPIWIICDANFLKQEYKFKWPSCSYYKSNIQTHKFITHSMDCKRYLTRQFYWWFY